MYGVTLHVHSGSRVSSRENIVRFAGSTKGGPALGLFLVGGMRFLLLRDVVVQVLVEHPGSVGVEGIEAERISFRGHKHVVAGGSAAASRLLGKKLRFIRFRTSP